MNTKEQFEKRLEKGMKALMTDGLWPYSPLWFLARTNLTYYIAKELGMNIIFRTDDLDSSTDKRSFERVLFLRKFGLFRNNKFIIKLNNILEYKKYLKRYQVLDGHKFLIKPAPKMMEIINDYRSLIRYNNIWEENTTNLIKTLVKPGMTCVDIGASVGYFTLLFSRQVGKSGKVVAIEPTDFQQPYLRKNIEVNGYKDRVTQVAVGAWDKDEIVRMPRNAPEYVQTELRCRPVDDVLEELGIMQVDFIKLDVDGPEPKVLKGLERTIKRSPNLKMVAEYYPKYITEAGLNPEDMMNFLEKYFTLEVIPDDYTDGCWNYLCTRK